MATCPNCNKTLTCGCQKRKASDGKAVCANCIKAYESKNGIATNNSNVWEVRPTVDKDQVEQAKKRLDDLMEKFKRK